MIGALKMVLGGLGVLQLVMAATYLDKNYQAKHAKLLFGSNDVGVAAGFFMEQLAAFHFGMAAINIFSWNIGSEMRPKVAVSNLLTCLAISMVYYRNVSTFPVGAFPLMLSVLSIVAISVGLILHQMEPGLLTQDKTKKKRS